MGVCVGDSYFFIVDLFSFLFLLVGLLVCFFVYFVLFCFVLFFVVNLCYVSLESEQFYILAPVQT